ncbi:MAG: LOG family protein, partial [Candidatus Tectomicrobia bacterium]|nr:LOG family protein [Candidatus Tectomicrobia bacterium]
ALRELRYAFKTFHPFRHYRKVSIFGSARIYEGDPAFEMAREFARRIREKGFMVITGAGEGIMKAGHLGAGPEYSLGVNIRLPFEQVANEVIQSDPKLVTFKYFFTRKLVFVKEADAFAMFPGGLGTHDEAYEVLTLLQTGKSDPMPIVFIDVPGGDYWKRWRDFVEECLVKRGLISPEDAHLFRITDRVEEAVEEISGFYRNYHSSRYVDGILVVRLQRPPGPETLRKLNQEFQDLLTGGSITASGPLPAEANEPEIAQLPRLVLNFNRQNFGRLRQLIDALNRY